MTSTPARLRITAIFTAYYPDAQLNRSVAAALQACDAVIVVDNTPREDRTVQERDLPGAQLISSSVNLGLAGALNLGIANLKDDVDAVVLFDQDSTVEPALVPRLAELLLSDDRIGIASPATWDVDKDAYIDPTAKHWKEDIQDVPFVVTSGMMLRAETLRKVGPFREDFFVELVDCEFCLRLRSGGFRIIMDRRIKLPHRLGEMQKHRFFKFEVPTFNYPPWRLYSRHRNWIAIVRTYGTSYVGASLLLSVIIVGCIGITAAYEEPRVERLRVIWRGIRDGILGRDDLSYLPASARPPASVTSSQALAAGNPAHPN